MLRGSPNDGGYYHVLLREDSGILKTLKMHRIIATAFIPNPNGYPQVNHIDGDKSNNRSSNLEWCSAYYNHHHARENGLRKCTLTDNQVHEICKRIQAKQSLRSISKELDISESAISHITTHGTHREIAKQYGIPYKAPQRLTPIDYSRYKKRRKY